MGKIWRPDPEPDDQAPAPPPFGPDTAMTFILDAARNVDTDQGLRDIHDRYPATPLAQIHDYVIYVQQLLEQGQVAEAERLTHEFAVTADRANTKPDATNRPVPAPRRALLRLKGWLHR